MLNEKISKIFKEVFKKQVKDLPVPNLNNETILLETGLDSIGFAILVVELEDRLGFDPFTLSKEAYYPKTFGEFVDFYEKYKPS
jgi:acyl carrier protein